ncbi:MAG TPA: cation diffusion facilitator family transporter [Candidatus Lachnoclostridium avicola]|nr:cation diffusion facilitator family transporter [Candidatus Lachnoclostridium avicola]
MTEFLIRHFVKDYQNIQDVEVRTRYGSLAGMVGICCNLLLFTVKLLTGLLVNSISVMADAFNNLSDAASSIISIVGVKMAEKPADEEHPFGHGRIEYISAFIVAFLVIEVGFSLFKTSFGKIRNPEPMVFQWLSVGILVLSVGVKLWMGIFNRKLGKRIDSKVMMATAADSLGDVAATTATIVSMLIFGIFNVNVDGIVGLAVSVVVMIAGVNIAKDTLAPLIGEAIDPEVYREITQFVESYDGIVGSHDLIVHNYGPGRSMASIHAEVPSDVDIETSHEIIDRVERDAVRKLHLFLVIHMDPIETKNAKVDNYRKIAGEVLDQVDSRLSLHDFRIVDGKEQVNLIFDLVVPRDYTPQMKSQVKEQVASGIREKIRNSTCVITVENSYCAEE